MRSEDSLVVLLLIAILAGWLYVRWRRRYSLPEKRLNIPTDGDIFVPSEEAVRLLNAEGYEIVAGKTKLPITVTLDGQPLESRLFIDAFAKKDGEVFVVKLAKERKPLELTGSGIRDRLLVYGLLYPEADGVLYVDVPLRLVRKIKFEIEP